jgi:hypothetical protein
MFFAVVKFGNKVTAYGSAIRAFSDATGDADAVPVNGMLRLNGFDRFAVSRLGIAHHQTAL